MKRSTIITGFLFVICNWIIAFGLSASAKQHFTLSGRITGLQKGDTLRFERLILPGYGREKAFDIIAEQADTFSYSGTQCHDQQYIMCFYPEHGSVSQSARSGLTMIVSDGDRINLAGDVDDIYYCSLSGGLYSDLLLSRSLQLEDSLGIVRSNYLKKSVEARANNDKAAATEYVNLFNNFGVSGSNPGIERKREAAKAYSDAHPEGSLYLLVNSLQGLANDPLQKSKNFYDALSPQLKDSYYGKIYAGELSCLERLAEGEPAPAFSVTTTEGARLNDTDFKGKYLLIYHWGLCPGSMQADKSVMELYDRYSAKGLEVLGLTESIDNIRKTYNSFPENQKFALPGVDDVRTTLGHMLEHRWKEVETDTGIPENKSLLDLFRISGWPFFVLIGPEGTIRARGFHEAFSAASDILEKELNPAEK